MGPKGAEGPLGPLAPLVPLAPWAFWPLAPLGLGWGGVPGMGLGVGGWGPTQGVSIRKGRKSCAANQLRYEQAALRKNCA